MSNLHIVSFTIPFPADYGGVIDVFYKIKSLSEQGLKIHLHCFEYDRKPDEELKKICEKIFYYKRKSGFLNFLSFTPFVVKSRESEELLNNLLTDDFPILFEGLHCCSLLNHPQLRNRLKLVRTTNIEHEYYYNLFRAEKNLWKKKFFLQESFKLYFFENILKNANYILPISKYDHNYFSLKFFSEKVIYIPAFQQNKKMNAEEGKGNYVLYHGNLSVPENKSSVEFLVENVFSKIRLPFKIAGKNPDENLKNLIKKYPHIEIISNPSDEKLNGLIHDAHINLLFSFHSAGMKIKLLNALYNGRFCLVNSAMLQGTDLHSICEIANDGNEIKEKVEELFWKEFIKEKIEEREKKLKKEFSNSENALKIIQLLK